MANGTPSAQARPAWSAGRLVGPKPPFKPKDIWAIRAQLRYERRIRDLALFNIAIDSKLRDCDLVNLRVAGGAARLAEGAPATERRLAPS